MNKLIRFILPGICGSLFFGGSNASWGATQSASPGPSEPPNIEMPAAQAQSATPLNTERDSVARRRIAEQYGQIPLYFEANQGQTDAQVKYLARGAGYALYLTPQEAVLDLRGKGRQDSVLRMGLVGANTNPAVSGQDLSPSTSNYLIGNDPKRWQTGVARYAGVRYGEVYPGIDLVYHGNQSRLEYDFLIAPQARPDSIRLHFDGASKLRVNQAGELVISTAGGELVQHKPVIYQQDGERQVPVQGGYVLRPHHQASFEVAAYDTSKPLVIDPVLVYSTYLGGSNPSFQAVNGIAVDSMGNAYITGQTRSTDFPTENPYQAQNKSPVDGNGTPTRTAAFISKLNPTGDGLVYSTYLGGSVASDPCGNYSAPGGDYGRAIAVDSHSNVVVVGLTDSSDFPTLNAVQASVGTACGAGFVTKLNSAGSGLMFSSYLTGEGNGFDGLPSNFANAVAVDANGDAFVTGAAAGSGFPTTSGAYQPIEGINVEAYITELGPSGALLYSTFLDPCTGRNDACSNSGGDTGNGIAVDGSGNVYVTGTVQYGSASFVTTSDAAQLSCNPSECGFVAKLNPSNSAPPGDQLLYATYLGGIGNNTNGDYAYAITVDPADNFYSAGLTTSSDFPLKNPIPGISPAGPGGYNNRAFVTKYNSNGTVSYSTLLGGSTLLPNGSVGANGIAADGNGNAYVIGTFSEQNSAGFPFEKALQTSPSGTYAFVTVLKSAGSELLYSTFFGGVNAGTGSGIALDSANNAYIAGNSNYGLQTLNAFQPTALTNSNNPFVAKISPALCGDLAFTTANYSMAAPESSSGSATISVSRTGASGCSDAASISYCSYAGTANGNNYSNVTGTVNWASGDTAIKTFAVPIFNSTSQTGDVTVNLQLNNPNANCGNAPTNATPLGADLGKQTTATLTIKPQVLVTPVNLAFGSVALSNTSADKLVTLTNNQTAPITVAESISGAGFAISSSTCGSTLAAAKSCTVSVTFAPSATGAVTGTLTLTDNPDSRSPHSVALSGTGETQTTVTETSLAFGSVAVGSTSAAKTITLENHETAAISVSASISGSGFAISGGTCGSTLAAAKTCTLLVTFTPTAEGAVTGALTLTDSPDSQSPHAIALSGTGEAQTTVTSTSEAFGNVAVGSTSAARTITLENHETAAISVSTSISGSGFAISGGTCGSTLAAAKTCTVLVTFTPAALGAVTGTLTLTDSPDSQSPHAIALSGTGEAQTTVTPATLAFGSIAVGSSSAVRTVTLENHEAAAISISTKISGSGFAISGGTCGSTLAAAKTCTVTATFTPAASGAVTGTLILTDSPDSNSPHSIALSGTGK